MEQKISKPKEEEGMEQQKISKLRRMRTWNNIRLTTKTKVLIYETCMMSTISY